ncbi:MAG: cupin domain-containing protein, partial [Fibromonadaceae bacterium]|nr:cupin domain-containing protein [Fibromonadaceae bacterium]
MNITVKKAGEAEKNEMESKPIWECEVSEFDWHYDSEERCLLIDGEVTV